MGLQSFFELIYREIFFGNFEFIVDMNLQKD